MLKTNFLGNVQSWAYQFMQYYKTKDELQTALTALQKSVYEAEKLRQAEEIKALQLENELQVQREHLGRDLHDGLGSQLTHIISRLDILAHAGVTDTRQLLHLSDFAREMNQTLRETVWLLNHKSISAEAFAVRLHGLLLKIWEDRNLPKLIWQFQSTENTLLLPPLLALYLVRITQEATNNAIKYAEASQVTVKLAIQKKSLLLTISDDGNGFDVTDASHGHGLTNMRNRTEELKGFFKIRTTSLGSCLRANFPLNN